MYNLNYLNLWSNFINQDKKLLDHINSLLGDTSDSKLNIDIILDYFKTYKNIILLLPAAPVTNIEKVFKAYVEARLGVTAIEFYKLKGVKQYIYDTIVQHLKDNGYYQIEEELCNYHEKLIDNYTPQDIHIISGGNEENYTGWY